MLQENSCPAPPSVLAWAGDILKSAYSLARQGQAFRGYVQLLEGIADASHGLLSEQSFARERLAILTRTLEHFEWEFFTWRTGVPELTHPAVMSASIEYEYELVRRLGVLAERALEQRDPYEAYGILSQMLNRAQTICYASAPDGLRHPELWATCRNEFRRLGQQHDWWDDAAEDPQALLGLLQHWLFGHTLVEADALAEAGKVVDGLTALVRGAAEASYYARQSHPWAARLLARYEAAIQAYQQRDHARYSRSPPTPRPGG